EPGKHQQRRDQQSLAAKTKRVLREPAGALLDDRNRLMRGGTALQNRNRMMRGSTALQRGDRPRHLHRLIECKRDRSDRHKISCPGEKSAPAATTATSLTA